MRHAVMGLMALVIALPITGSADALEKIEGSRIVSASLFKNGLAMITREVEVSGADTYLMADVPSPVHGTFWIESEHEVDVRVMMRDVKVAPELSTGINFQEQLSGQEATVHFRDQGVPPMTGRIVPMERPRGDAVWNRQYQQPRYNSSPWPGDQDGRPGRFLILDTGDGREYVDTSTIARLSVSGREEKITARQPVMLLTVKSRKPSKVRMSYLTKGLSWAPSYRVDLAGEEDLTIEQKAIIKNELADFSNAEVFLISGFPNVQFGHVTSPLSLQQTWATFFQQLNTEMRSGQGGAGLVSQQQAVFANAPSPSSGLDLHASPSAEGPDIHYQPAGRRTLLEGDSIMFPIASVKTSYERIVEWIVPDTRTAAGRHISEHEARQNPDKYQDAMWDAIRFRNPLPFPMTTGAAMITGKGKFLGETMSFWVNEGEETTLHITKALSIRTRSSEKEEPDSRQAIYIGGRDYRRVTVVGELMMNNYRNEDITLVVRKRFSGDLLDSTGDPKSELREEGAWSVNKRNELTWGLTLEPGEEQTLTYRYTVLVD